MIEVMKLLQRGFMSNEISEITVFQTHHLEFINYTNSYNRNTSIIFMLYY